MKKDKTMKWILWVCLAYIALRLCSVNVPEPSSAGLGVQKIDRPFPPLSLVNGASGKVERTEIKGPAFVVIFASWCGYCAREVQFLTSIQDRLPVPFYGIAISDTPEKVETFLKRRGNPFVSWYVDSPDRAAATTFSIDGVPDGFLVDENGIVRYRISGYISEKTYAADFLPRVGEILSPPSGTEEIVKSP